MFLALENNRSPLMGFEPMNGQGEIVGAHRTYLSHT